MSHQVQTLVRICPTIHLEEEICLNLIDSKQLCIELCIDKNEQLFTFNQVAEANISQICYAYMIF